MFKKSVYNNDKILLELGGSNAHPKDVYEPVIRKLGGVWNRSLNGWIFGSTDSVKVDQFIEKNNINFAETENKEYYTKFSEEPTTYNTPSSRASSNLSTSGINEAFDLIQELFDRVTDLEKIIEEHGRRLNVRK